jgi:putrescine transport system substrate-binding protein
MTCLIVFFSSVASSQEEKVLNIYTWADYLPPNLIRNFETEFGIRVNYATYDNDLILGAKLLAGNTGFDLVGIADPSLQRYLPTGAFRTLDKSKVPNLRNLDTGLMRRLAHSDPGNAHAVIYTWGSTGIAYNEEMVKARMPDAPLDSAAMIFDPAIISRFADCGVTFLDDAGTMIRLALLYLGHDINTTHPEAFAEAERLLKSVRPYIRYFSSVLLSVDLPAGEVCVAVSWTGEYGYVINQAKNAKVDMTFGFVIPKEGSNMWIDTFSMPADLPHPENAHLFLNYLLRPEVTAEVPNVYFNAVANNASLPFIRPEIRSNPVTYPPPEVMARIHNRVDYSLEDTRVINRIWARVKADI